jgi:hypothetical protein
VSLGLDVRGSYLQTLDRALAVLAAPEVAAAWDAESALPRFTVGGLAGHTARAGTLVEQYLDAGFPDETRDVADAAEYYEIAAVTADVDDAVNTAIRERGEAVAAAGHAAVVELVQAARVQLQRRLAGEPATTRIAVTAGMVLPLDEYLVTRMVELVTHTDDLAVSVGIPSPEPDPVAATLVIHCLVSLARRRHGDLAVVRALTRRERDVVEALRTF